MGLPSSQQGLGPVSLGLLLLLQFLLDASPQLSLGRISMGSNVQLFLRFIFTHQLWDDSIKYFLILPAAKELWRTAAVTESQNHRMFGTGKDLCGSSSPTALPKQSHLQQAAQDLVQEGLEYLQRSRLHKLPGQPVPLLRHPQREEVLRPHVQMELPVLQFVPVAPCPVAGHH